MCAMPVPCLTERRGDAGQVRTPDADKYLREGIAFGLLAAIDAGLILMVRRQRNR